MNIEAARLRRSLTRSGLSKAQSVVDVGKSPAIDAGSVQLEVFHRFEQAEAIWRTAENQSFCHIFQSFDWLVVWHKTIGNAENVTPCIVHVMDAGGDTVMLLPLGIYRKSGLAFLGFLGGLVSDYHAPLIATEFSGRLGAGFANGLLTRVLKVIPRVDVLAFERMPVSLGAGRNPFAELDDVRHVWSAHLAHLPSSFDEFKKSRKSKLFSDTERRRRLLNQLGETRVEVVTSPEARAEVFDAFVRHKSRRWLSTGARNLFASPAYVAFYRALAERSEEGVGHLSALRVGDTIIAVHLGAVFRSRFYYLMPAHAGGDWGRFSAGRQLLKYLIEWSITAKLKEFDFTVGDEAFKGEWADQTVPLYDYRRGVTAAGRLYCQWIDLCERLRTQTKRSTWLRRLVNYIRKAARPAVAAERVPGQ